MPKDKALKKRNRSELIEIIYQLKIQQEGYEAQIKTLRQQLDDRKMKIDSAGSLAEASAVINGLFEKAQATADLYLEQIAAVHADAQHQAKEIVSQAEKNAYVIREEAERYFQMRTSFINKELNQAWSSVAEQLDKNAPVDESAV